MRQHPRIGDLHAPLFDPTSGELTITTVLPPARPDSPRPDAVRPDTLRPAARVETREQAPRPSGPPVMALAAALALVVTLVGLVLVRGL
jgi:hypothetical protein